MSNLPTKYRLMTAVVQWQDVDNATSALQAAGLFVIPISSSGAFLGRRNATLLIGLQGNQEQNAVESLDRSCRRRVEYIATRLEGAPFHLPLSTPVTIGGATIFTFEVERWEVIK
jgi:uncharacterized protein YaaQ